MTLKNPSTNGDQITTEYKTTLIYNLKSIIMKKFSLLSLAVFAMMTLTSCDAIGTIFKAGMWWAVILIVGVISLILWLFGRGKK